MGKYDGIVEKLDKLPDEEGDWATSVREEVRRIAHEYPTLTPAEAAREYRAARDEKDKIEEVLKEINKRVAAWERLVMSVYEVSDITTLKLADGTSVSLQHEPIGQIFDKERFRQWCIDEGLEANLQLPWQTMNKIVKEKLEAGEPEPPGVKAYVRPKFVLRRAR